jgi:hypothetical protein
MEGFYTYPQLRGLGIHYSREHIRRLEKDGLFPMHTDLDEDGRRIAWGTQVIDDYREKRKKLADANERVARAETKRLARAAKAAKIAKLGGAS